MAVDDFLAFTEGSEFRKEAARQIAKRIAALVDVQELIAQGEGYTDDLLEQLLRELSRGIIQDAAVSARLHARTLGLSMLSAAEVGRIVENALAPVLAEAMDTLGARVGELSRAVSRMMDSGVSEEVIRRSLSSEAGAKGLLAPLVSVLTATGAGLVNATEKAVLEESVVQTRADAAGADEPEPLFRWVTMEDDRVCEDLFENSCAPRHNEELTMDEWGAFGLPGSENTICSYYAKGAFSNCRCQLEAASVAATSPVPVKITDAIERGRERAAREYADAA